MAMGIYTSRLIVRPALVVAFLALVPAAWGQTGLVPLNDLGTGLYLDRFQGGLYPAGSNRAPAAHAAEGVARALAVTPRDAAGNPDAAGKYALMSVGMSNTTQEFCSQDGLMPCDPWTFMGQAAASPLVNHATLALVNGARGGQSAATWDSTTDPNYARVRRDWLTPNGLSAQQVQVAWVKVANPQPRVSLPDANADAYTLVRQMADTSRALKTNYPNLQQVFFSSRIYAGYATSTLNPEPYAYESGFAVIWLVEAQIEQMETGLIDPVAGDLNYDTGAAPWLGWGPYLWADGPVARSDGLTWLRNDLGSDGTHPARSGEEKVADLLMDFMLASEFTHPWFLAAPVPEPAGLLWLSSAGLLLRRRRRGVPNRAWG